MLNNLGALDRDTGQAGAAEKDFIEASSIFRELAARDPDANRATLGMMLNNLGLARHDIGLLDAAEKNLLGLFRSAENSSPATPPRTGSRSALF